MYGFEELARFKNIPGAETFVGETYAQLRKYGCWVISVIQQYNQIKDSPLCSTIFDNSRQFFLMRQNSASELDSLVRALNLPDTARAAMESFDMPDDDPRPGPKPTSVLLVQKHGSRVECGVLKNVPSEELLYMAASGGEHFDARRAALARYTNITFGIMREVEARAQRRDAALAAALN